MPPLFLKARASAMPPSSTAGRVPPAVASSPLSIFVPAFSPRVQNFAKRGHFSFTPFHTVFAALVTPLPANARATR